MSLRTLPSPAPAQSLARRAALAVAAAVTVLASGCATVTREPLQRVSIVVVDEAGRPLPMRCRVINGAAEYYGDSPMHDVQVRRSASNLEVECRHGTQVARGTAISRGTMASVLQAVLPGGTALVAIDHLTGYHYAYPSEIRVRIGEHLVFDSSRPRGELAADTGNRP
jgi:hypothetical protein